MGVNLAQPLCKDNVCLSVLTSPKFGLNHMCELEPGNTRQHPLQIQEIMHALTDTHVDLSMGGLLWFSVNFQKSMAF